MEVRKSIHKPLFLTLIFQLHFHRDTGNIVGAVNVIICKKHNSKGGDLHVPDYDATIGQQG
jgi:hypothetical protein